jgi:hypothetical protein
MSSLWSSVLVTLAQLQRFVQAADNNVNQKTLRPGAEGEAAFWQDTMPRTTWLSMQSRHLRPGMAPRHAWAPWRWGTT